MASTMSKYNDSSSEPTPAFSRLDTLAGIQMFWSKPFLTRNETKVLARSVDRQENKKRKPIVSRKILSRPLGPLLPSFIQGN